MPLVETNSFGTMLKQRRKDRDLTQAALAGRVGCAPATIRMIETGERRASRQMAELLADQLGVAPGERELFVQAARTTSVNRQRVAPGEQAHDQVALDLPAYLTPLVGRAVQLAALEACLLDTDTPGAVRLLTLTGPAGVGKTRLASALAAGVQREFADGVYFVALAPLRDPQMVIPTIAVTLGVREQTEHNSKSLLDALRKHLLGKEMLLVLDNMEQLIAAGPEIAATLQGIPTVKALVTSREPLHVRGESVFPVLPLALPDPESSLTVEALGGYSAVTLFVERARAAVPGFALNKNNAAAVTAICARLDGLPLAIELVAARVRMFPPRLLRVQLEAAHGAAAFRLLGDGARDLPERHRTLQAAIGWSYDLLSKAEQILFAQLGVFVGGCTLSAIEAICTVQADSALDALDGVASLLDKSLVQRDYEEAHDAEPRFRLLETVREYTVAHLEQQGQDKVDQLRRRHAEYFLALAEAGEQRILGDEQPLWFRRLAHENNNIQAALAWLLDHGEAELAARLAGAMGYFWNRQNHTGVMRWFLLVLEQRQHISPVVLSNVLRTACTLAIGLGELTRAQALAEENLAVARGIGEAQNILEALIGLGAVAIQGEDFVRAELSFGESLRLAREVGHILAEAQATIQLGEIARARGDYHQAKTLYAASLRLTQETGSNWGSAVALHNLGKVELALGNPAEAGAQLKKSLLLFNEIGSKSGVAYCLVGLAEVALKSAAPERSVTIFSASAALLNSVGVVLEKVEHAGRDASLEQARANLAAATFKDAWETGNNFSLEEAVNYALE